MRKSEIIKQLRRIQTLSGAIADMFESTDKIDRISQTDITFTVFKMVEIVCKTEIAIYNYLKRRGWK